MSNDQFTINNLPKKTYEITGTIPWSEIDLQKQKLIDEFSKEAEIKGFRKGHVPKNIVEENINKEKLRKSIFEKIIPEYYKKSIDKFSLKPVTNPKLEIISTDDNKDWVIKFTLCETPEINLSDYKERLKKALGQVKIWTPDKDIKTDGEKKENREEKINKVLEWLGKNLNVEISDLLIEEETNNKLAGLLEQTQKLGISIDQYLASTNQSVDEVKKQYSQESERILKNEFILSKIAEQENVIVSNEEIQEAISKAKNDEEKHKLEEQKYLLALLIRQQKTLDFLTTLI